MIPQKKVVLPQGEAANNKTGLACAGEVDLANKAAFVAAWRKLEQRLGAQGITVRPLGCLFWRRKDDHPCSSKKQTSGPSLAGAA